MTPSDLGAWMRNAREAEGLSQRELAAKNGVSLCTVYNWEHGLCVGSAVKILSALESMGLEITTRRTKGKRGNP